MTMKQTGAAYLIIAMLLLTSCTSGDGAAAVAATTIQFMQQDSVQSFDLATGAGRDVGTVTGSISGTSVVQFQFTPSAPPTTDPFPITFSNKVTITDLDGDQIYFDNNGTGSFHLGVSPGFSGSGGPLVGTYVVTGGTGKYQSWTVGRTFQYHAIWTSPTGSLGTAYSEIRE